MAAQLQLTHRYTDKPADLIALDAEICKHMGVPVDDDKFCFGWMDTLGLGMAVRGREFDPESLKGYFYEKELTAIYEFIMKDYSNTSYGTR